jgi:cell division protein FtsL
LTTRLLILILVLIADVGSALGVVYARHQSRHLAVQLGALEVEHDAAVAEWSRLQLEQAWLADAGQIENTAREKLQMVQPAEIKILVTGQ